MQTFPRLMDRSGKMNIQAPRPRRNESGAFIMTLPVSFGLAQRSLAAGGLALVAVVSAACAKNLPPAPTPERVVPPVDTGGPIAEGQGRLVLDVVEGPTAVQRVGVASEPSGEGRVSLFFDSSETLCPASPCAVDLPQGNVLLQFPVIGSNAVEMELVHIGSRPTVYRRSLSRYDASKPGYTLGIVGAALGGTSAMTGAALLPIGLADRSNGLTIAGATTLGVGAAVLAVSIWMINAKAPSRRSGSSVHFPLP
jgi:hypothetical protein